MDKDIVVRLKWGETEYKGRLVSVDLYMNIQLNNTEEFIDGKSSGQLGQVLIRYVYMGKIYSWNRRWLAIFRRLDEERRRCSTDKETNVMRRCNNVLWIGAADQVEPKPVKDTTMSG